MNDSVVISTRFRGPPDSGNGGYVCGLLGERIEGAAQVRLRVPPPLETPLAIAADGDALQLLRGDEVIAEARPVQLDLEAPPAPSRAQAESASKDFRGFSDHFFEGCFVCGTARDAGDGLRIFCGPLGADLEAAGVCGPWHPDDSLADADGLVRTEFLWAALDCPGGFAFDLAPDRAILLGELTARIEGAVRSDERCTLRAWSIGCEGRKHFAGSALYGEDGTRRGVARATWFEVPRQPS